LTVMRRRPGASRSRRPCHSFPESQLWAHSLRDGGVEDVDELQTAWEIRSRKPLRVFT